MRFPDGSGEAVRCQALVQPADLVSTLLEWWARADPPAPPAASLMPLVREEIESLRDRLAIINVGGEWAMRTPAWYLRHAAEAELFAKPDDRWEVNDVADRCEEVVEMLRATFSEYEEALRLGNLGNLAPLDDLLLTGLR